MQPPPISELLVDLAAFANKLLMVLTRPDIDWRRRPQANEWTLNEVIWHLCDVEQEVHQVRFQALLTQNNPFMPGAATDEWARERNYYAQDGRTGLDVFLQARQETIDLLSGLDSVSWQRYGRHAFFGATSLHELVYIAVKHDAVHWEQIQNLLGGAAKDDEAPIPK